MKYIIIGNSTAAVGAVEGIRSIDKKGDIDLFSSEEYHTYSRPLISYLLCGKTDMEKMKYRPDDFYVKNNVKTHFSLPVEKIDALNKTIYAGGETFSYDKLMVACGSRPFIPPAEGLSDINYYTFGSLNDALKLQDNINKESKVLIVGAGLIGLKCAEGIFGKVKSITIVDMTDRVLSSVLDKEASDIVKEHLKKYDFNFYLSRFVKKYSPNTATLDDDTVIPFDVLIIAVGVRPNIELVKDAAGKTERGIWVDERGETSLKDVYAAGDCVMSYDITTDSERILALLPNAYSGGYNAGVNMAGGNEKNDCCMPMNSIGFMGLHIITAGSLVGQKIINYNGGYKKLVVKDGCLNGFILVGNVERAGIYTRLIREKIPLISLDFDKLKIHPCLASFNENERQRILGEEV